MKDYYRIYNDYFDGIENVIQITQDESGQICIGFSEDYIFISYILDYNWDISTLINFPTDYDYKDVQKNGKYINNRKLDYYKIIFNLIYCLDRMKVNYIVDMHRLNACIERCTNKCRDIKTFIKDLKVIIEENIKIENS